MVLLPLLPAAGCAPLEGLPPPPDAPAAEAEDRDGDGTPAGEDCDDGDRALNPDDLDADGFSSCEGDCDDANPTVFPGAPELCDDLDNDCDGEVSDRQDLDGDGFSTCGADADCDDGDPERYPGAPELCDDRPNDCLDTGWVSDAGAATFFGADGAADLTAALSGQPGAPGRVTLDQPGELRLCAGSWTAALTVAADVTIRGDGPETTALSGGGAATVVAASGEGLSVRLEDLTLTEGRADTAVDFSSAAVLGGGGLRCDAAEVALTRVTLEGNDAELGGGIFATSGCALSLSEVVISGNRAELNGGGLALHAGSEATVASSRISGNSAGQVGGGLYMYASEARVSASALSGNDAQLGGGMGLAYTSDAVLEDTAISGNTAESGGGIHLSLIWLLSLTGGRLSDNEADYGGGAFIYNAALLLRGVQVAGNRALEGGGVYLLDHGEATSEDSEFSDNTTDDLYIHEAGESHTWGGVTSFYCHFMGCE